LTACASGGGDPSNSGKGNSAGVQRAEALVKSLMAEPKFVDPGGPVDMASLAGKRVMVIPTPPTAQETAIETQERQAAAAYGVKLTYWSSQGQVSDWVQGMTTAIGERYNAILLRVDPRSLQPQIKAARAAGIPVIVSKIYDTSDPQPPTCDGCAAGVTSLVDGRFSEAGTALAAWPIADSKGDADILGVTLSGFPVGPVIADAMQSELKKDCPECKITFTSIDISQIGSGPISGVATALTRDPKINYVVPLFGALLTGSLASIMAANRQNSVRVETYNAQFAMADLANPSSPVKAIVGESNAWDAYANMDQVFRTLAGHPGTDSSDPLRLFDASNVSEAGAPNYDGGFGDFATDYKNLWK
jgi:ribose transport system substrate-binding protein